MLIADGSRSRFYRRMVLNPDVRQVGIALGPHAALGAVAVVTVADGYGPEPLACAVVVAHQADGGAPGGPAPPPALFRRALESVPSVAIHDRVRAALARGAKIKLDYKPGKLVLTVTPRPGAGKKEALCLEW